MKMLHKSHRIIAASINLAFKINHLGILSKWPAAARPKTFKVAAAYYSLPKNPCRRLARSPLFFARIVVI